MHAHAKTPTVCTSALAVERVVTRVCSQLGAIRPRWPRARLGLFFKRSPAMGLGVGGVVVRPSLNRGLERGQGWAARRVPARAIAPSARGTDGPLVAGGCSGNHAGERNGGKGEGDMRLLTSDGAWEPTPLVKQVRARREN